MASDRPVVLRDPPAGERAFWTALRGLRAERPEVRVSTFEGYTEAERRALTADTRLRVGERPPADARRVDANLFDRLRCAYGVEHGRLVARRGPLGHIPGRLPVAVVDPLTLGQWSQLVASGQALDLLVEAHVAVPRAWWPEAGDPEPAANPPRPLELVTLRARVEGDASLAICSADLPLVSALVARWMPRARWFDVAPTTPLESLWSELRRDGERFVAVEGPLARGLRAGECAVVRGLEGHPALLSELGGVLTGTGEVCLDGRHKRVQTLGTGGLSAGQADP